MIRRFTATPHLDAAGPPGQVARLTRNSAVFMVAPARCTDDIRWFAPNRFCTLVVPRLRTLGLTIALEGDRPARLAIAMDAQVAAGAYRYAARHRWPLIQYVWDLPPWR